MDEVGIDTSEQHSKGLKTCMGKVGFSYSIVVCARVEKNCPKTFPGVGTRLVWAFEDPRGEDIPEEERPVPGETLTVPHLARPLVGVS
jgi:hypothetical protein